MCCLLNAIWAQHHTQTAPLAKNWIMPVQDRAAVTSYVTHEYWRMGSDTVSDNLSWATAQLNFASNDNYAQQQAQRITRAASPIWLQQAQQAQQALNTQQAQYEASGDLQIVERGQAPSRSKHLSSLNNTDAKGAGLGTSLFTSIRSN